MTNRKTIARIFLAAFLGFVLSAVSLAGVPQTKVHKPTGDKMEVESGGEIELKSGSTLDVQSGASVNLPTVSVSSGTFSDYLAATEEFDPPRWTEAELKVSTPTLKGRIYYDTTNDELVKSTGTTTCFDYSQIHDKTAAPVGW